MKSRTNSPQKIEGGTSLTGDFKRRSEPDRPLISVVTVCFNSVRFLKDSMESVLNQTYDNIEYILVDGGSYDGTLDIIKEHEDHIAYWVSEPDEGIFDAMNKGVSLAKGDLVGILNSDDRYPKDALEEIARARLRDPAAQVYYGNVYVISEDGDIVEHQKCSHEHLDRFLRMNHQTCFIERSLYEKHRYPTSYKVSADYHLLLSLYLDGKKFHHVDKPLAYFRLGGNSSTYYGHRRDIYKLRREFRLITLRRYFYKRFVLVFNAIFLLFRKQIEKTFFPEHEEMRATRIRLAGINLATEEEIHKAAAHITKLEREIALAKDEIRTASAHIMMLEREVSLKNKEIETFAAIDRTSAQIAMLEQQLLLKNREIEKLVTIINNNGMGGIPSDAPATAKFFFCAKREGVLSALKLTPGYIVRKVNSGQ